MISCAFPSDPAEVLWSGRFRPRFNLALQPVLRRSRMPRDNRFATPLTRLAVWVAIAIVMSAGSAVYAAGQNCPASPTYTPDFSSNQSCMSTNGNAMFVTGTSTVLQLTSSSGNQTGSAWYNTPQVVQNGFTTSFQFQFTNPSTPPADGITFVIQNAGINCDRLHGRQWRRSGIRGHDANTNPSQGERHPQQPGDRVRFLFKTDGTLRR